MIAVILIIAGIMGYVLNVLLIAYFINKTRPGYWAEDETPDKNGTYEWEHTAGTGIVPKWVSLIGLIAVLQLVVGTCWGVILLIRFFLTR